MNPLTLPIVGCLSVGMYSFSLLNKQSDQAGKCIMRIQLFLPQVKIGDSGIFDAITASGLGLSGDGLSGELSSSDMEPNTDESILAFAQTSFNLALSRGLPLFFSTKDNVMKKYDGQFRDIFQDVYETHYAQRFKEKGITYEHRLIDDMVAYMMKSEGGFILALKSWSPSTYSFVLILMLKRRLRW